MLQHKFFVEFKNSRDGLASLIRRVLPNTRRYSLNYVSLSYKPSKADCNKFEVRSPPFVLT
jgi:hypothetical protein